MNLTTLKKVTDGVIMVIFFDVVGFVLSKSFQQYQWCHYWSFGVPS
jgi:hypothetical protein